MAKFKQEDVISLVKDKSGYYKTDLRKVFAATEESIIEILSYAKPNEPIEIKLFDGFVLQAKRELPKPVTDPRNGEKIMSREKIKPNVKLKRTFMYNIEKQAGLRGGDDDECESE
jgi:nucleoid DNA-binding protein